MVGRVAVGGGRGIVSGYPGLCMGYAVRYGIRVYRRDHGIGSAVEVARQAAEKFSVNPVPSTPAPDASIWQVVDDGCIRRGPAGSGREMIPGCRSRAPGYCPA